MNYFDYIKKYGNRTYTDFPLNEIDLVIFSQLSYLDFSCLDISNTHRIPLFEASKNIRKDKNCTYYSQKRAYYLIIELAKYKRFKNLLFTDYEYRLDSNCQFGALTIITDAFDKIISFEGTDATFEGWREDFLLATSFPTSSHALAADYLHRNIDLFSKKVYVTGHSKGANVALGGCMLLNFIYRFKIKEIYGFDGPGLRKEEFYSGRYLSIKKKLRNIVPEKSFVGIILNQENLDCVKSNGRGLLQHDPYTWLVSDYHLIRGNQNISSINLKEKLDKLLDSYTERQINNFINNTFNIFREAGCVTYNDIFRKAIPLYKAYKNKTKDLNEEEKKLIEEILKIIGLDFKDYFVDRMKDKVKRQVNKISNKVNKEIRENNKEIKKEIKKEKNKEKKQKIKDKTL